MIRISNGTVRWGRTAAQVNMPDDSFGAIAAAHSRAYARISADIAAAINTSTLPPQQFAP